MITRQHLRSLLYAAAILVTVLAVLGAVQAFARGMQDESTSQVLGWIAGFVTILACANVLLLVAALAIRAIQQDQEDAS